MSNKNFGCDDIATAVKDVMTMANLSGFISQDDNSKLRQFDITKIEGTPESATIYLDFAEKSFKLDISFVPKN